MNDKIRSDTLQCAVHVFSRCYPVLSGSFDSRWNHCHASSENDVREMTSAEIANRTGEASGGFQSFEHAAADIILAASFDAAGTKVAICSADHKIRVYSISQSKVWNLLDRFRGHDAEILDVCTFSRQIGCSL